MEMYYGVKRTSLKFQSVNNTTRKFLNVVSIWWKTLASKKDEKFISNPFFFPAFEMEERCNVIILSNGAHLKSSQVNVS